MKGHVFRPTQPRLTFQRSSEELGANSPLSTINSQSSIIHFFERPSCTGGPGHCNLGITMKKTIRRRCFLKRAGTLALVLPSALQAADAPTVAKGAVPTLVRTRELMAREPNPSSTAGHVWRLHQSATSRTNLVEMRGVAGDHIHPDAEHSLYVISGEVMVH